eukprot:TRINITY_DN235717_c0_g1_i1.p1 TRINITY_DN235717_c0_g1~~TRINITY_DN235717_c0_g1_i1.p1  ORF type:complete len:144 (-),score=40.37 TRINITY_DN235717_c0_g1_i1:102-533(-)
MSKKPTEIFCGGFRPPTSNITPEILSLVKRIQPQVQKRVNRNFVTFQPVLWSSQVVAGVNYMVKVRVGYNEYVHIEIFSPLPYTKEGPRVVGVCEHKKFEDVLVETHPARVIDLPPLPSKKEIVGEKSEEKGWWDSFMSMLIG